ncbi:MAG: hypothetical protein WC733_00140 [Methylophilus sp.]|jgi:hypothetical protein
MDNTKNLGESAPATEQSGASISKNVSHSEDAKAEGFYTVTCTAPIEEMRDEYIALLDRIQRLKNTSHLPKPIAIVANILNKRSILNLEEELAQIPLVEKWVDTVPNTVTTVGKNYLLDNGLAGSAFTAAFYLGLISSVTYTAISAADTMSSHTGWVEAGSANVPIYSQSARPTAAWSSASAGSKAFSSALSFTIATTGGTVKGCFLTTVATKDGTTGTLYSAGLFSGGDKVVAVADTLNVTYTASL